jgi:hypothetical protein
MRYQINHEGGHANLALYLDGQLYAVGDSHPYWEDILDALRYGDGESVTELIDLATAASNRFRKVTDRVAVSEGGVVTFDGDVIDNSLADAIVRAMRNHDDADFLGLSLFMENVYQNPRKHSRDNLFDWLRTHDFSITPDGMLVGYKGVSNDLTSISSGPGIVNGVAVNGHLDNSVGNVLEMARSSVEHDPSRGCSVGLHVGTWSYASSFGPKVLKVLVNPRDVVSVPTDCGWEKMRVCRYKVHSVIDNPVTSFVDSSWDDDWNESNW